MDDIPLLLLEGLSSAAVTEMRRWWSSLADNDRREVIFLWDERQDLCFFPPERNDLGEWHWHVTSKVIGGRFTPCEDDSYWEEWRAEYFDYLRCNPELVHFEPPVIRTFHICSAHDAVRAAVARCKDLADFHCPLRSLACPMRELLGRLSQSDSLRTKM